MIEFEVLDDGLLAEKAVHELARWYSTYSPTSESIAYEAHIMLTRAFTAVANANGPSAQLGLTRARYNFLRMLYRAEGKRMLLSEVGDGLNVSGTNITKLTDSLVRDGLVRRVSHPQDRRMILAELTDSGIAVFEQLMPQVMEFTERLWSCLDDQEKRMLVHLLAKLRRHILSGGMESRPQLEPEKAAP